jgi:CBS domain-containing protein
MTHAYMKDIMTADVVAVRADAPYRNVAAMFRMHRVSGFPVVDDDRKVVGVVSETDLLADGALDPAAGVHPSLPSWLPHRKQVPAGGPTAGDLVTRPAVTIGLDDLARHSARLMYSRKLGRLPVVDRDGRLAGIVTRADVLSVFTRPDEEIRREITQDVIMDGFFFDPAPLTVTVKDGIVTLAGALGSGILGTNIANQVQRLEGVVAVRDLFTYPAPARTH